MLKKLNYHTQNRCCSIYRQVQVGCVVLRGATSTSTRVSHIAILSISTVLENDGMVSTELIAKIVLVQRYRNGHVSQDNVNPIRINYRVQSRNIPFQVRVIQFLSL